MKKKLTCHCGEFVAEVNIPDAGINKIMRCNCTLCKRKGYVIGVLGENDFKIVKGENFLKLYQYYTKAAKHYFCSICGIHTHNRPRINPKIFGINVACVEGMDPFELENIGLNDGENHPLDQNK
ncbi:MAG: GFA family protein [Candidatus Pelagibacter sp.]|tara:strand:+ start:417 stop:788 length:372 start_codon:yes stop_codon:yes gene_type:complete